MGLFRTEPLCLLIRAARIKAPLTARTKWGRGLGEMSFMTFVSTCLLVPGQHLLPRYSGAHLPHLRILRSYSLPQYLLSLGLICLLCNKKSELGLGNKFGEPTQEPCGSWLMHPYQGILSQGPKQRLGPFVLRIFLSKFPETMPTVPVLGSCEKELKNLFLEFSSVQSLSRVRLFATP